MSATIRKWSRAQARAKSEVLHVLVGPLERVLSAPKHLIRRSPRAARRNRQRLHCEYNTTRPRAAGRRCRQRSCPRRIPSTVIDPIPEAKEGNTPGKSKPQFAGKVVQRNRLSPRLVRLLDQRLQFRRFDIEAAAHGLMDDLQLHRTTAFVGHAHFQQQRGGGPRQRMRIGRRFMSIDDAFQIIEPVSHAAKSQESRVQRRGSAQLFSNGAHIQDSDWTGLVAESGTGNPGRFKDWVRSPTPTAAHAAAG